MLVCAHKERQALHFLGKEHQIGCSGCTEYRPGQLIYVRTCVCEAKYFILFFNYTMVSIPSL